MKRRTISSDPIELARDKIDSARRVLSLVNIVAESPAAADIDRLIELLDEASILSRKIWRAL